MNSRLRTMTVAQALVAASLVGAWGAAAAASDPGLETVDVPPAVKPSYIMVDAHGQRDHPTIRGRTFTFRVYTGPKCIGVPPASLRRVRVVERPKSAGRPFKSVLLTPYVQYPAHTETIDPESGVRHGPLCARDAMPSVRRRVRLKRPGADLIFFDGSMSPPRRVWPPPVG